MSKDLNVSRLCDVYGALLTEHRLELVRNYYDYDLSLAEIAENFGITRQAALCSIKQAEKQLREFESKLGLLSREDKLTSELSQLAVEVGENSTAATERINRMLADLHK